MSKGDGRGEPKIGASVVAGRVSGENLGDVRSVVLGTAGHIDHGKTALVLALTGTDTDRLPEEKARGITIDLGFAALDLVGPGGVRFDVSLIDVPGHHAFIRNMLAGAGGIEAVMLVVAADEGVKAQTVEHLQICRLLGIQRGVVVLTKRDAVDADRLAAAFGEVERLVKETFLEGAPVLAVSALRREGISELKSALVRVAAQIPVRSADRVARLPVDRVFSMRGFGTVVTGTLQAGVLRAGQSVLLQPSDKALRVRGLQVHGKARAEAAAPNRVALNLAGVEIADVQRGDTVVPEQTLEPVSVVDVEIETLPGTPALRHRQRVRVHAFASESLATVLTYEGGPDQDHQLLRLRLTKPMVLIPGDRFVLRQPSPAATVGGGQVVDAHPAPRLRKAATVVWLRTFLGAEPSEQVFLRAERRGSAGIRWDGLVAETGLTRSAVERALAPAIAEGRIVAADADRGRLIAAKHLAGVEEAVGREVSRSSEQQVSKTELRSRLRSADWVLALALQRLQAARVIEVQGESVMVAGRSRAGTGPVFSGRAAQVEEVYRAAGLAAPIVSEAAERLRISQAELRGAITTLLRAGRLVRMGSDALLMHGEALERLKADLRLHRGESFDVSRFKAFTGLSRKHAIPLLEYLDGVRVTRNAGGVRFVI